MLFAMVGFVDIMRKFSWSCDGVAKEGNCSEEKSLRDSALCVVVNSNEVTPQESLSIKSRL